MRPFKAAIRVSAAPSCQLYCAAMSFALFLPARQRWRCRSLTVQRWLLRPRQVIRPGQALCILQADGEEETFIPPQVREAGNLVWLDREEGEEIGLNGYLWGLSSGSG